MVFNRIFCLLVFATMLMTSTAAWSAEIHGSSSTQFLWFNNFLTGNKQAEFGEYLNLSVTKIDKDNKLSFQGYGRVTQDVRNGQGINGRLYYLYGDYRDLYDKIDLRFGRQFVNYAAGSALIDGGKIDLKNVGPIGFSVMGGRNVFFDLNGEGTRSHDFAFGVATYLNGFKNTDAELSYFMKFDKGGIAREMIGATLDQHLFNSLKLYTNARYDLNEEVFSDSLVGVKYYPTDKLVLTGEWYYSHPTFDQTSIYSLFNVDNYQEAVFRADYTINDIIGVNAGYKHQYFQEGDDVDMYQIGTTIYPIETIRLKLDYDYQIGDGDKLNGGAVELFYKPIKTLELSGGVHYDTYEHDRVTGRETAREYWLGSTYKFTKSLSASVRVEDNVNRSFKDDWSGRVVVKYDF